MPTTLNWRDFMRLAAPGGGVAFASALPGWAAQRDADFYFVQLSGAHWGFEDPAVNPDSKGTLPFLCDIFCGSGHETMNGVPVVG